MLESAETQRRIGCFAWVMAWVGLVLGQLHALARFATEDGKEDLEMPLTAAWAKPAADLLQPLLGWADPDIVYITYGKIWFPVFLAFTLGCVRGVPQAAAGAGREVGVAVRDHGVCAGHRVGLPGLLDPVDRQTTTATASRPRCSRWHGSSPCPTS